MVCYRWTMRLRPRAALTESNDGVVAAVVAAAAPAAVAVAVAAGALGMGQESCQDSCKSLQHSLEVGQ